MYTMTIVYTCVVLRKIGCWFYRTNMNICLFKQNHITGSFWSWDTWIDFQLNISWVGMMNESFGWDIMKVRYRLWVIMLWDRPTLTTVTPDCTVQFCNHLHSLGNITPPATIMVVNGYSTMMPYDSICQVPISLLVRCVSHIYQYSRWDYPTVLCSTNSCLGVHVPR